MRQLPAKQIFKRAGQHHDAILGALALAHDDYTPLEIDVLDSQGQAFGQTHPRTVQKSGEQPGFTPPSQTEAVGTPTRFAPSGHGASEWVAQSPAAKATPARAPPCTETAAR
jgi:hypothetical protein